MHANRYSVFLYGYIVRNYTHANSPILFSFHCQISRLCTSALLYACIVHYYTHANRYSVLLYACIVCYYTHANSPNLVSASLSNFQIMYIFNTRF
jgi:hypothetical protein